MPINHIWSLNVEERSRATLMPSTPPEPPSEFLHKLYETVRNGLNTEEVLQAVLCFARSIALVSCGHG